MFCQGHLQPAGLTKEVQYTKGKLIEPLNTGRGDQDKALDSFGCCSDKVAGGDRVGLLGSIAAFPSAQHQRVMLYIAICI